MPAATIITAQKVSERLGWPIPAPTLVINAAFPLVSISLLDLLYNTAPERRIDHLKTMSLLTPLSVGGALFWEWVVRGSFGPVNEPELTAIRLATAAL